MKKESLYKLSTAGGHALGSDWARIELSLVKGLKSDQYRSHQLMLSIDDIAELIELLKRYQQDEKN